MGRNKDPFNALVCKCLVDWAAEGLCTDYLRFYVGTDPEHKAQLLRCSKDFRELQRDPAFPHFSVAPYGRDHIEVTYREEADGS